MSDMQLFVKQLIVNPKHLFQLITVPSVQSTAVRFPFQHRQTISVVISCFGVLLSLYIALPKVLSTVALLLLVPKSLTQKAQSDLQSSVDILGIKCPGSADSTPASHGKKYDVKVSEKILA